MSGSTQVYKWWPVCHNSPHLWQRKALQMIVFGSSFHFSTEIHSEIFTDLIILDWLRWWFDLFLLDRVFCWLWVWVPGLWNLRRLGQSGFHCKIAIISGVRSSQISSTLLFGLVRQHPESGTHRCESMGAGLFLHAQYVAFDLPLPLFSHKKSIGVVGLSPIFLYQGCFHCCTWICRASSWLGVYHESQPGDMLSHVSSSWLDHVLLSECRVN